MTLFSCSHYYLCKIPVQIIKCKFLLPIISCNELSILFIIRPYTPYKARMAAATITPEGTRTQYILGLIGMNITQTVPR